MARVSDETLQRYSKERRGEHNPHWKGDNVGNMGLHDWVKRHLPKPDLCQRCFTQPPYDLANVTGIYKRDLQNWKYLCRKCHMEFDGRLLARVKGRFVSPKRVKVYSVLRRKLKFNISPNIFVSSSSGELK